MLPRHAAGTMKINASNGKQSRSRTETASGLRMTMASRTAVTTHRLKIWFTGKTRGTAYPRHTPEKIKGKILPPRQPDSKQISDHEFRESAERQQPKRHTLPLFLQVTQLRLARKQYLGK